MGLKCHKHILSENPTKQCLYKTERDQMKLILTH